MIKWVVYISLLCFAHYANGQWDHLTGFNSGNDTLNIQDFHFFNANEGIVVCSKSTENPNLLWGYVLKTTDGGNNWDTLRIMQDTVPVSLKFTSETVGHMLCKIPQHTEIRTFSTSDSGLNWTAKGLVINANPPYQDIEFYNDSVGVYSTNGFSAITNNGGVSWNLLNNVGSDNIILRNNFIILASGNGYGVSYDTLNSYSIGAIFESGSINSCDVAINNEDTTILVSALGGPGSEFGYPFFNYGMLAIGDFHKSQYDFFHFPEHRTRIVTFINGVIYVGCANLMSNGRRILKSIDGGSTWWSQEIIDMDLEDWLGVRLLKCLDNETCFAAQGKSLYKTTNGGGPLLEQVGQLVYSTPQEEEEENPDTAFLLYPNPFTNQLKIESDQEILTIQITDLNGKLVYSGTHNTKIVTLETASLSNAVYIITIEKAEETIRRKVVKW
jgi:photosystem II stability/assembly factor-like uncharacterized protein